MLAETPALTAMKKETSVYLACPRYKNRPKKHIIICRQCKWKAKCKAFALYQQPELFQGQ